MKKTTARVGSSFTSHRSTRTGETLTRRMPACRATGLPCFDERQQAGDAVKAFRRAGTGLTARAFRCDDCTRWHVDVADVFTSAAAATAAPLATGCDGRRGGRIIVLDIENATLGARGGATGAAEYLAVLRGQALRITGDDLVIVVAARPLVRVFQETLTGPNVTWLAGADEPDGADRAALDWLRLNLRRLAPGFEELVLISGDHAFARAARRGRKYGLRVRVVTTQHPTGRTTLSRELSGAAHVRTTVRLEGRDRVRQSREAVGLVAGRPHRRVHVESVAA